MQEQHEFTPDNLPQDQNKVNPNFDLSPIMGAQDIINEAERFEKEGEAMPHVKILRQLIEQIEPLDFETLANPQNTEDFKLNTKHYLILSIENVLQFAETNSWGLCKNHDFIYLFNAAYWSEIDKESFQKFLGEAAERMGVAKFAARFYQFREQLFKQFLTTAYLPTPESDNNTVLINLKNGTFEISPQGTKLRPFERSDFLTYQLPFDYNPEATAPLFMAYLNKVQPDLERQRVLAEYLGYLFIKHGSNALKEEKALILYGTGANGKSVFFEVVSALLGSENVSNYSLQSLTNDNGYSRAKLANKLLNYATEINGNLEASIFKQLVSGEAVEARLPYGQPFILRQYAKLIFNCNELPKDVEYTNAYFRRFLIIPFDVTIPESEQDKTLHTKIIAGELSGVFNWVLEGLNRLLKNKGFSECNAAKKAVEKYQFESDSVNMFLSEYDYKPSNLYETPLKNMMSEYKCYCMEGGFRAVNLTNFAKRLRRAGYETERKSQGNIVYAEKISLF